MNKKKIGLAALALALCIGVVFAIAPGYFLISNEISEPAIATRTPLIDITVEGYPADIEFGKNYTFTVTTKSLADQELTGLVSWITISYVNSGTFPHELKTDYFYIYYNDSLGWEGEIQDTFVWNDTEKKLVSTAMGGGSWDAPVDYINEATVTFRIDAYTPLPDVGTLTWEAWVEAPLLP